EPCESTSACTYSRSAQHKVTGAVPDDRARRPPKIGDHEFSDLAIAQLPSRSGLQHFADVLAFIEMQTPGGFAALKADRTDFGQAMVIDDSGAPRRFHACPR